MGIIRIATVTAAAAGLAVPAAAAVTHTGPDPFHRDVAPATTPLQHQWTETHGDDDWHVTVPSTPTAAAATIPAAPVPAAAGDDCDQDSIQDRDRIHDPEGHPDQDRVGDHTGVAHHDDEAHGSHH